MTKKRVAFLFPGQGAQYVGMAKSFYDQFATARQTFEEANDLLSRNLSKIIFEGPEDVLVETRNSQSGIFVASLAILNVIQELFPDLKPTVCAGLSLGEYSAVAASEKLGFKETLNLVEKRGQFMNDACETHKGTMAVIMGLESSAVEELVKELALPHDLWAANFNCPLQVVISGSIKGVEAGMAAAKAKGAKLVMPLKVYGAFHSGLMQDAGKKLAPYIQDEAFKDSSIQLVMNVPGNRVSSADQIKKNLIDQVTSPVRWEQGIREIEKDGVDGYLEIGCGKVLSGFNRRIGTKASTLGIENTEHLALLEQILR